MDGWESEGCLICGANRPAGHFVVHGKNERRAGRVCSSHTLKELILDSQERFLVSIELTTEGVEAIERVETRRKRSNANDTRNEQERSQQWER
jgi:hypothetical protein